jgi:uncharacterized protein with GYD domain
MPSYLLQVAYTPQAWDTLIRNPQNRMEAVAPAVEQLGGSITGGWLAFGEYDLITVIDLPDNISAAAFSMAVQAGGAISAIKTTPLMSIEDAVEAMRKAGASVYEPATT